MKWPEAEGTGDIQQGQMKSTRGPNEYQRKAPFQGPKWIVNQQHPPAHHPLDPIMTHFVKK